MVNLHQEFEDAIKFAEQLPLEGLMKSNLYRYFYYTKRTSTSI